MTIIELETIEEKYELKITKKYNIVICRLTTQNGYSVFGIARIPVEKPFIKDVGKRIAFAQAWKHFITPLKVNIIDNTGNPIIEN